MSHVVLDDHQDERKHFARCHFQNQSYPSKMIIPLQNYSASQKAKESSSSSSSLSLALLFSILQIGLLKFSSIIPFSCYELPILSLVLSPFQILFDVTFSCHMVLSTATLTFWFYEWRLAFLSCEALVSVRATDPYVITGLAILHVFWLSDVIYVKNQKNRQNLCIQMFFAGEFHIFSF